MTSKSLPILGSCIGDIVGSIFEWNNYKNTNFDICNSRCFMTDDTVMTIAVADALYNNKDLTGTLRLYGNRFPDSGYGGGFRRWLKDPTPKPYNSYGNGSAMRVSAAGVLGDTLSEVLKLARQSAEITHNHPEGIKGAEATAAAIYLARTGSSKEEIKEFVVTNYHYHLDTTCDEIRPVYQFNETCQGTVPPAIVAFMESTDFESAIRLAVSLGGDTDTLTCITGGIAAAFYNEIPDEIAQFSISKMPTDFYKVIKLYDLL